MMRRKTPARWGGGALAAALVLAGCADPVGPKAVPFAILWAEWPAQVTPAAPGVLRVTVLWDFCSDQSYRFSVSGSTVTLATEAIPRTGPCPLGVPITPRDTLLALPSLAGSFDNFAAVYGLQALVPDLASGTPVQRGLGPLAVGTVTDTMPVMGGLAFLGVDSLGCNVLEAGYGHSHAYAVVNPPALGGERRQAQVRAHAIQAAPPPGCGTRPLVQVDEAIVALIP
jgi:hypothetical protein